MLPSDVECLLRCLAGMRDEIELKIEVGELSWTFQELRDEVDPWIKVRGRICIFCLVKIIQTTPLSTWSKNRT